MSKLVAAPITKGSIDKNNKMSKEAASSIAIGSRNLAKAILDTKKLYRKMTIEEQIDAMEYAYGIKIIFR